MNRAITDITKFVCCILIFIHHFYLRNPIVYSFGYIACTIFFFLSAFGVYSSLERKPLKFYQFVKSKVKRIVFPVILVNITFLAITSTLLGVDFKIPIFRVFCDNISFQPIDSIQSLAGPILGFIKIDSVTWFIDVLLLAYLFIWGLFAFHSKVMRNVIILIGYSGLFVFGLYPPPLEPYYIIDTFGIVLGLFYAINRDIIDAFLCKYRIVKSVTLILFVFLLVFEYFYKEVLQFRFLLLIELSYVLLSVVMVIYAGMFTKYQKLHISSLLGGISFFIYLVHVKIACIVCCLYTRSFFLTLGVVFVVALLLMKLNNSLIKK